jgi:hypothetical protein
MFFIGFAACAEFLDSLTWPDQTLVLSRETRSTDYEGDGTPRGAGDDWDAKSGRQQIARM